MEKRILKGFLLITLFHTSLAEDILFKRCKIKEPDFDNCLTEAIQDAVRKLKNGYRQYKIPPLDPAFIPKATIGAGSGVVHLTQNYVNLTAVGYSNSTISNAHMDFNTLILTYNIFLPRTVIKGTYDIEGRIMALPVIGRGPCTVIGTEISTNHKIQFEPKQKGSNLYYIPKSFNVKMVPKLVEFNYENLFGGNKLLGDNINKLLNEEWKSVFDDVGENYEQAFANLLLGYAKLVFTRIPAKQLFLE